MKEAHDHHRVSPEGREIIKSSPILFSAPMVCALLDGIKTQTRRPYKVRKHPDSGCEIAASELAREPQHVIDRICPYGLPGDRLWVRETWANVGTTSPGLTVYRADYPACIPQEYQNAPPASEITWKPSIHMFRKDSRIKLEIVSVRVERLQDISEADVIAEGAMPSIVGDSLDHLKYRAGYQTIWESINGAGSWEANPWVWVVQFRRIEQ